MLSSMRKILKAYKHFLKECENDKCLILNKDKRKLIHFHLKKSDIEIEKETERLKLEIKTKAMKILGNPEGIRCPKDAPHLKKIHHPIWEGN